MAGWGMWSRCESHPPTQQAAHLQHGAVAALRLQLRLQAAQPAALVVQLLAQLVQARLALGALLRRLLGRPLLPA